MRRLLFSLYGFSFFNKFLLLTPVYAIFMQQNGVSDVQLSTMFIISSVATVLGQLPITFITNRIGGRWAMIFGQFLKMFAVLLWLVWPTYAGFAAGMVLWGLQAGFRSVAFEGLMYDSIKSYGRARDYSRILGRKYTYESIGVALSACGSLLMFLGYNWVTWASVGAILMSVWCLMLIRRAPGTTYTPVAGPEFRKMFRTGVRVVLKTPCLLSIMLLALLVVNIPFLDDFLSPIGLQLGIATEYVGIVSFFLLACATIGQRLAYRLNRLPDMILYIMIGCVGVCYMLFALLYSVPALLLLGLGYMMFYGLY
ncbi:MAG: MFS transporter, partial [Alphaproteobacteria bacterium]|nr:MFS transporter [Alphaproteobacteria bacterium]